MKRRNFIKLLPALAAVPVVVKSATETLTGETGFLDLRDTPDTYLVNGSMWANKNGLFFRINNKTIQLS